LLQFNYIYPQQDVTIVIVMRIVMNIFVTSITFAYSRDGDATEWHGRFAVHWWNEDRRSKLSFYM